MGKCLGKSSAISKYRVNYRDTFPAVRDTSQSQNDEESSVSGVGNIDDFFTSVISEKERFENMSMEEKRMQYRCRTDEVLTLADIAPWGISGATTPPTTAPTPPVAQAAEIMPYEEETEIGYTYNAVLNSKISLVRANISMLEIDAVVNSANRSLIDCSGGELAGGSGVSGAIHRGAGGSLKDECLLHNMCEEGDVVMTSGYQLPARYVLHTVGPMYSTQGLLLAYCYKSCLELVKEHELKSVAFPCISAGTNEFPLEVATDVALQAVRSWMASNRFYLTRLERIIFCVFSEEEMEMYNRLLREYFPLYPEKPDNPENSPDGASATLGTERLGDDTTSTSGIKTGESVSPPTSGGARPESITLPTSDVETGSDNTPTYNRATPGSDIPSPSGGETGGSTLLTSGKETGGSTLLTSGKETMGSTSPTSGGETGGYTSPTSAGDSTLLTSGGEAGGSGTQSTSGKETEESTSRTSTTM